MAGVNWKAAHFALLTLVILHARVASSQEPVCSHVDCGQGTCLPSNASLLGFECQCQPGWKKMQIGPVTLFSCVIPNCTVDFQCGSGSPPVLVQPLPPFNLSDPCSLTWCGDGTCVPDGAGHICKCNEGSANLLNMTTAACFNKCSFGSDCNGIGLLPSAPQTPPPDNESSSTRAGSSDQVLTAMSLHLISMALLLGVLFI